MTVTEQQQEKPQVQIGLDQLVQERAKFLMEQLVNVIPYVKELDRKSVV